MKTYLYVKIIYIKIPNPFQSIYRAWYRRIGYKKRYPIEKARAFLDRGEWAVYKSKTGEQVTVGLSYEEAVDHRETFARTIED